VLFYDATHSNAVKYAKFLLKNDLEVELFELHVKSRSETHYIFWHWPFSSSSVTMMKVFTTSFFSRKGQRLAAGVVPPPARVSTASCSTCRGTSWVYISIITNLLAVTSIKQPTCLKQPNKMFPNVTFVLIFTSVK